MLIPNYGFGGAQRVHSQLVRAFSSEFNVVEVVFNDDERDVYDGNGIKISLNIPGGSNLISKTAYFLWRCWKLYRLKAKFRSSACISHMEGANFVNLLSFGHGKKILCVHGSKVAKDPNRSGMVKFLENYLLIPFFFNLADHIVAVSGGIRDELIVHFRVMRNKICVINNGINLQMIRERVLEDLPLDHQLIFRKPVIVFSGRLALQKNPVLALDIFDSVRKKVDCNLIFLGDGPLKNELIGNCKRKNINFCDFSQQMKYTATSSVFITGFQSNPFKYLKRSSLFILTSNFEGFPLAVCEALACELPVIASDCETGVRDILSAKSSKANPSLDSPEFVDYGVLMPLVDAEKRYENLVLEWAKTIIALMEDKAEIDKFKRRSTRRSSELSEEVFVERWMELLRLNKPSIVN